MRQPFYLLPKWCILHISWAELNNTEKVMSTPVFWWSSITMISWSPLQHKLFRWIQLILLWFLQNCTTLTSSMLLWKSEWFLFFFFFFLHSQRRIRVGNKHTLWLWYDTFCFNKVHTHMTWKCVWIHFSTNRNQCRQYVCLTSELYCGFWSTWQPNLLIHADVYQSQASIF